MRGWAAGRPSERSLLKFDSLPGAAAATAGAVGFPRINRAYDAVFRPGRLSLGLVVPLEAYVDGPVPTLARHVGVSSTKPQPSFSAASRKLLK